MKKLFTGNEAVAQGAWEAGLHFAAAYPGTPSTEIVENLSGHHDLIAEWAPNEKVALESVIGASLAGGRALAAMKHVGLNVAADPLFTFAYTGVNGGTVIVTADDPGMFSSQDEQDNRNYARAAKMPMLEPSDSGDAYAMSRAAFELSERFDAPILLRMTTRVCHSKSIVETDERREVALRPYQRQIEKYVTVPAVAKKLRLNLENKLAAMREYAETSPFNIEEITEGAKIGVICSGVCYHYAHEVLGDEASYLKLGFTYPLPPQKIRDFCAKVETVYIIEENDPYLEEFVRGLGITNVHGKDIFPACDEQTPDVIRRSLYGAELPQPEYDRDKVVSRPPALCAGCPHRGFFYEIGRRKNIIITGDIGCYTLGSGAPFKALDSTICMGASISMAHGAARVLQQDSAQPAFKVVSVMGDSTFFHSGMTSLLDCAYNGGACVNVVLDNRTTGMTGHQDNPGTGYTAQGGDAEQVDIAAVAAALGIKHIRTIDPNDLRAVKDTLDEFLQLDEPSLIITRYPCALKKFSVYDKQEFGSLFNDKMTVDPIRCVGCKVCLKAGCPALSFDTACRKAVIDPASCLGCNVCAQLCNKNAIVKD